MPVYTVSMQIETTDDDQVLEFMRNLTDKHPYDHKRLPRIKMWHTESQTDSIPHGFGYLPPEE